MAEIPERCDVPARWHARYEDCLGPEIWYTAKEMVQVLEELGTAEARIRELEQELTDWIDAHSALKMQNSALQAQLQAVTHERDVFRGTLIAVGRNLGCLLADDVSTEFLALLPVESALHQKQLAQLQARNRELRSALKDAEKWSRSNGHSWIASKIEAALILDDADLTRAEQERP